MNTETVTPVTVTPRNRDAESRYAYAHPQTRTRQGWAGRLAVMASRGETSGPRVDECRRALSWLRLTEAVRAEVATGYLTSERADKLINQLPITTNATEERP